MTRGEEALEDALEQLSGWNSDPTHISRTLTIDETQHADLTERIKIYADALELTTAISRFNGCTHIEVLHDNGVTLSEVKFAARVEDAYKSLAGHVKKARQKTDEPNTGALRTWWHKRVNR